MIQSGFTENIYDIAFHLVLIVSGTLFATFLNVIFALDMAMDLGLYLSCFTSENSFNLLN